MGGPPNHLQLQPSIGWQNPSTYATSARSSHGSSPAKSFSVAPYTHYVVTLAPYLPSVVTHSLPNSGRSATRPPHPNALRGSGTSRTQAPCTLIPRSASSA